MSDTIIRHVVVPGTFDPVTLGHLDVIARTRRMFSQVTIGVAASLTKNGSGPHFSLEERAQMLRESIVELRISQGEEIRPFSGLLMDLCRTIGADGVVKGLRAMTDFEYELQQADLNYRLAPEVESIFVMGSPRHGYISSSIVRELALMGGDVSFLVPACVKRRLATLHEA